MSSSGATSSSSCPDNVQLLEAIGIGIALFSAVTLYMRSYKREINAPSLMPGGVLYLIFFAVVQLTVR